MKIVGWAGAWVSPFEHAELTDEKRNLFVEYIRYKHLNYTYQAHQTLPYAAPLFSDGKICVLTNQQWNDIIAEAYGDEPLGRRLMPADIIKTAPINDALWEKGVDSFEDI